MSNVKIRPLFLPLALICVLVFYDASSDFDITQFVLLVEFPKRPNDCSRRKGFGNGRLQTKLFFRGLFLRGWRKLLDRSVQERGGIRVTTYLRIQIAVNPMQLFGFPRLQALFVEARL